LELVNLNIRVRLTIEGKDSTILVKSIIDDHKKFIKCRRTKSGFSCSVSGQSNDVRKTINEFLESLAFIEKTSEVIDARVG
jgi:hypothetical protein